MDYTYIYFPGSPTPKLMLPLGTKRLAYDQSPYAAAAKLPSAHAHRTAQGHTVIHGQRPIFHSQFICNSLQVLDSLIKIVNYIKSGALNFSGTSLS